MQKVLSAFIFAILFTTLMDVYAVIREPDMITLSEIEEHVGEVVRVEGTLVSWLRDPYDEGANRIDLTISEGNVTARVRWYETSEIPTEGSRVAVTGEVVVYNEKIYLESTGLGALEILHYATLNHTAFREISEDPESHNQTNVVLEGWLKNPMLVGQTWCYLSDHPDPRNARYSLRLTIEGGMNQTLYTGTHVRILGNFSWNPVRYWYEITLIIEESTKNLTVLRIPDAAELKWYEIGSGWSYEVGNLVSLEGNITKEGENWWVEEPNGWRKICLLATGDEPIGEVQRLEGILAWGDSQETKLCLDRQ